MLGLGLGLRPSRRAVAEFGPNLVTNGTFTGNANGWTLNNGPFHEGSYIAFEEGDETSHTEQAIALTEGATYEARFTISNYSEGSFGFNVGGSAGTPRAADGTFTENIVAGASDWIRIEAVGAFPNSASIDNASLRRVL